MRRECTRVDGRGLGQNNIVAGVPEIIEMENRKRKKYQADVFSPEVIRSHLSAKNVRSGYR